jgi:hypothetical protein
MVVFSERMVPERMRVFWDALQAGEFITEAAAAAGTYRVKGRRWMAASGGIRPRRGRNLAGRYLSLAEREEIALGRARGESIRDIAGRLHRSPSTVSRELRRNADQQGRYRATSAHARAYTRAARPKPAKLASNVALGERVERDLNNRYSPEQVVGRLRREFPDDPGMWVSHETIYQSLYVQSRGALRRELTKCLRTGRAMRRPGLVDDLVVGRALDSERQQGVREHRDREDHAERDPGGTLEGASRRRLRPAWWRSCSGTRRNAVQRTGGSSGSSRSPGSRRSTVSNAMLSSARAKAAPGHACRPAAKAIWLRTSVE